MRLWVLLCDFYPVFEATSSPVISCFKVSSFNLLFLTPSASVPAFLLPPHFPLSTALPFHLLSSPVHFIALPPTLPPLLLVSRQRSWKRVNFRAFLEHRHPKYLPLSPPPPSAFHSTFLMFADQIHFILARRKIDEYKLIAFSHCFPCPTGASPGGLMSIPQVVPGLSAPYIFFIPINCMYYIFLCTGTIAAVSAQHPESLLYMVSSNIIRIDVVLQR